MSTFVAEPLIENTPEGDVTHEVVVTLAQVAYRQLVGDFAAAIASRMGTGILPKVLAAGSRPCGITQQRALDELIVMLAGPTHRGSEHALPPSWSLTPAEAARLLVDLAQAIEEPVQCRCGRYVEQPTQLTDTCGPCTDRADLRVVGGAP